MYIYNVTSNVDDSIHDEWLKWMQTVHIPQVLACKTFYEAKLTKVLVEEDMGGQTYSVQYRAKTREDLNRYYTNFAETLKAETLKKFADRVLSFRTELEVVDIYTTK